jgi:outer membrane protein insertion porin family
LQGRGRVTPKTESSIRRRAASALLVGTILGGYAVPAAAAVQPAPAPTRAPAGSATTAAPPATAPAAGAPAAAAPVPAAVAPVRVIRSLSVTGNQRLETDTVLSYMKLHVGQTYDVEQLDQALKDLLATELFADVQILGADTGNIVVQVRENPVINRIILEGNKRLKDEKINPEIKLAPRQIFTRSKARADVARIIELYRRQGRFAATVEPKIVQLEQNRVDVVFEINEGPLSRIRQINIIGNENFSDHELRGQLATKRASLLSFLSSGAVYDPDRLAYDQQKLRQFYLTQGYADFRVVSAVAELTPDRRDFIITFVVEEGQRYKFGDVKVESNIRDFKGGGLTKLLPMHKGDWYNEKLVEDTLTQLNEAAGLFGYAFADVQPDFHRDKEHLTMGITFNVAETPRVYVERININGNKVTRDKVIRREFRVAEGDPFNSVRVKRSRDRIQSLGYFQDNLEIEQSQGSGPDRVNLAVNVQEKATGQLQISAGYSSLERFLVNLSIEQRNFMGKGQTVRAAVNYSTYSKSVELGFTEPYVFDRNVALGFDLFRRDYSNFNYIGTQRNTTYKQVSTGGQIRTGIPITEYLSGSLRYGLNYDQVTLDQATFYTNGQCDPLIAGRYLCEAVGNRLTSSVGYSLVYDSTDNQIRPTRGQRYVLNQDVAGLGGDVHYIRTRVNAAKFWRVFGKFIFSLSGEGGYIKSFDKGVGDQDPVRLVDRFFLGEPQIRGFDIRGVGPRIQRLFFKTDSNGAYVTDPNQPDKGYGPYVLNEDRKQIIDDAIGGRAYYLARAELEIPVGASFKELGLRPSIFADIGAVFGVRHPTTDSVLPNSPKAQDRCVDTSGALLDPPNAGACTTGTFVAGTKPFFERFQGDTPRPRLSIGFGVNWNSPFGPFRIDIAKAIIKAPGDAPKLLTFNVGTAF